LTFLLGASLRGMRDSRCVIRFSPARLLSCERTTYHGAAAGWCGMKRSVIALIVPPSPLSLIVSAP
jgi:hypothetical protein